MHDVLLVVHVLGAAAWIGGGIITLMSRREMVAGGGAVAARWMKTEAVLGKTFFPVAAVVTVLAGIGLVLTGDEFSFSNAFVIIGVVAWLFSAAGNSTWAAKQGARAEAAFESGDDRQAMLAVASTTRFHYMDNAVLILALVTMVYRIGS